MEKDLFKNCSPYIKRTINRIGSVADEMGITAYVVGGIVRDILLGRNNDDLDILVESDAVALAEKFAAQAGGDVKRHKQFGTASIIVKGTVIDVATCRAESYEYPGALPTVRKGALDDDLFRRDFTINTLAAVINKRDRGRIIDLYSGIEDLDKGIIRVLHKDSFKDDPTRIFRAVRFEQRLGFRIEPETLKMIKQALNTDEVDNVKPFRYFQELKKILNEPAPLKYIRRLTDLDALKIFGPALNPDLKKMAGVEKGIASLGDLKYRDWWFIRLMSLLNRNDETVIKHFCKSVHLTKQHEKSIVHARREKSIALALSNKKTTRSKVFEVLSPLPEAAVIFLYCASSSDIVRGKIFDFLNQDRFIKLNINGNALLDMGCPAENIGKILRAVMLRKIEDNLRTKRQEAAWARKILGGVDNGKNGKS